MANRMASMDKIVGYLDKQLLVDRFKDYSPNGLQVEGKKEVNKVATGVTASLSVVSQAIESDADLLLVHHGYFWKGEDERITGMKHKRLKLLLAHDLNLLAYHLPLDAHPEYGNNAQLAKKLGIVQSGLLSGDADLVGVGEFNKSMPEKEVVQLLHSVLLRKPLHIGGGCSHIKKVAWCTGGAQNYFKYAIDEGVDAYISGEVSEQNFHLAKESGVHYFAAGHHATERYGVQALGDLLSDQFNLEHVFIDENNPV